MLEIVLTLGIGLAIAVAALALVVAARARGAARRDAQASTVELAASLDPAEVVRRTLDAATALDGVHAAVLTANGLRGEQVHVVRGVSEEEAARAELETPPNHNLRAMEVVYRYRLDETEQKSKALRAGLIVPLQAEGRAIGTLTAFTRSASGGFPKDTVAELERLAWRAGPALDNAHRFTDARVLADIDSLTGLHNRRCFHELLGREVARAGRYNRQLSLIVFDLDNFKSINDRVGHLSGDAVLAEVAARVRSVVRLSDIACRVGGDEFGVVMPETSLEDAERLANRIARTVAERPLGQGDTLYVSAGVAQLREDNDADALFERADEALYRAKEAGKARTIAAS